LQLAAVLLLKVGAAGCGVTHCGSLSDVVREALFRACDNGVGRARCASVVVASLGL
jgi:hypothetical protein